MEVWKDLNGFEGLYLISSYGVVKSLDKIINCKNYKKRILKGRLIKPVLKPNGYLFVRLKNDNGYKNLYIHRIVALNFIENTYNKPQVNHKNCNKSDNNILNLEWVTNNENMSHAVLNKRMRTSEYQIKRIKESNSGENSKISKLSNEDVKNIRYLYASGKTQGEISKMYNVSRSNIGYIVTLKSRINEI